MSTGPLDTNGQEDVCYLSLDPLTSTVGASQVLAYVERLAENGVSVRLHSFEHRIDTDLKDRLRAHGVDWRPHAYGLSGPVGGLGRVVRAAWGVRGTRLGHARSDLAALALLLARVKHWVWDVRSLYVDQKIATGIIRRGSVHEFLLRMVERLAARRSSAIVALTESVLPELDRRHSGLVSPKAAVITTCVDTQRFVDTVMPDAEPMRVLMLGTLNRFYDVETMLELFRELRRRHPAELVVASPEETAWEAEFNAVGATRLSLSPADVPRLIASCHVGLSVCRDDAGVALLGAMPTKIGELLSSGRPVVVNPGLVDIARLLESHRTGVVLGQRNLQTMTDAAGLLDALVGDPAVVTRARRLALENFDLDLGVQRLAGVYRAVSEGI